MVFFLGSGSKGSGSHSQSNAAATASGLAALQSMTMAGLGSSQMPKDLIGGASLFPPNAAAETQAFIKQQQKLLQQLPANSPQRKSYEALLNDIKQAHEYNKYVMQISVFF